MHVSNAAPESGITKKLKNTMKCQNNCILYSECVVCDCERTMPRNSLVVQYFSSTKLSSIRAEIWLLLVHHREELASFKKFSP